MKRVLFVCVENANRPERDDISARVKSLLESLA
jgi:hypothetical protein